MAATVSATFRKVQAARTRLLLDQPFFGVLALQLKLIEDASCDTAWTDGVSLGFSPAFIDGLTSDQLVGLIAHEVMHCACGHPWRRESREAKRWNIACDYAINDLLIKSHFQLPAGGLHDPQYAGKCSEWIYDRLPQQPQDNNGNGNGNGNGQPDPAGEVRDAPNNDPSAATEADWQQATKQAQAVAEAQGKLPSAIARQLKQLTDPRVDWRSVLRKYIQDVCKSDYSWTRPNVRYIPSGLYLPALHAIQCGPIAVAVDTSGSIDDVILQQFATEIQAIASEVQPARVDVLYCDAKVHRVDTFERGDLIEMHACGGGGTDFRPVFNTIADSGEVPAVLVYLTDMYGTFPTDAPEYPVIWAVISDVDSAPFGDVVPCRT